MAPKKDRNTSTVKKPKSPSQVKDASRKNAGVQMATEKTKIVKMYPVSEAQVDTPKKVASKRDTLLEKAVEAKTAPRLKDDKREGARAEEAVKIRETKGGKKG
ncbi:MAG: hypothetical protein JSW15_08820, partial [Deltaproteobacteria bacterium]